MYKDNINGAGYRVFFFLCSEANIDTNIASVSQKQIAEVLGMNKSTVSKAIHLLLDDQYLARTSSGFMINPNLIYAGKGYENERNALREDFSDNLIKMGINQKFELDEETGRLGEPFR
nr:helix-turn-helix domain-containing protein [Levilactobacillus brevis]